MLTSNYTDNYVASVVRYTYADSPNVAKLSTALYTDDLPEWCKQIAEFFFCTQSLVTYNGELLIRLQVNRRSRKALLMGWAAVRHMYIIAYLIAH